MAMALAIEIPFLQLRNIKLCKQLTPRAKWPNIPFCIWDNQNPWPYFGEFSLFAQLFWILWYFSVRNGLVQQKILKARAISGFGNTAFLLSGKFDMLFLLKKKPRGTSINDVSRFLAISDLPTYLVLLYNVPFLGYLGPPTYPNKGRH